MVTTLLHLIWTLSTLPPANSPDHHRRGLSRVAGLLLWRVCLNSRRFTTCIRESLITTCAGRSSLSRSFYEDMNISNKEVIDRLGDIANQVRNLECRKVCADQGIFAGYHHSHSKCALPCEMTL
ncbi:hypothetical protein N7510_001735 [Penicillium lagena]|uniref:uncharacterized protein n=1 Tax=Penicillium lagena TaxID=94218 RepID=UPI0025400E63|nr:uncharacterized protein N7510_001735 [Penicillium lagena]KAJ5625426.1 hypothetical protein N7510_001735 [Penicillium lagena]